MVAHTVEVIGGGDSALQEALTLANYADRVIIFHHGTELSGHTLFTVVLSHAKLDVRRQMAVEEILGDEGVTGVRVRHVGKGEESQIDVKGVFVYVGLEPNTAFLRDIIQLSDTGHVPTDISMKTELPGLYAVGDIRQDSPAQAITSAGDGAVAAIAVHKYIRETFA